MKRLTPILLLITLILVLTGCSSSPEFYTVTFDTDGAVKTVESQQVRSGSRAVEPKDPVKEGTLFREWTLNGEKYDFSTPVTGNITLKASYCNVYTVTFNTNGGSEIQSQKVIEGTVLTKPADPVKEGTTFCKWNRVYGENNDVEYYDFKEPVTSDLKLFAVYNDEDTCIIIFDSNDGSQVADQIISSGEAVSEPKNPTKEGVNFKYWVQVKDGKASTSAYNFSEPVSEESITLKAVYYCTVTFWSKGGSSVQNDIQHIDEGGFATEPASPAAPSSMWGFREWVLLKDDGTTESFDFKHTQIKSDMTFWATFWDKYTVTYRNADGTVYKTEYVKEGTTAPELEGPEKDGAWSFSAWVADGTTVAYDFTTAVNANLNLTATYVEGYRVTFDSDGGDYTPSAQFIKENGTVTEPKNPDKASTRGFMWWTKDGSNPYDFSSPVTSSFTLKAVYWPSNMITGEDSTGYDENMYGIKNEVECMHFIIKKLVQNDELMKNRSTDFSSAFGVTFDTTDYSAENSLVLGILTNALLTPDKVTINGNTVNTEDLASYELVADGCSIASNTTEVSTNDINTKYTVDITGLKIRVRCHYDYTPYIQEAEISVKGTFIKNSDERYELHIQMTVNGTEFPVLHAIVTKSGNDGDDNVLFFSYKNVTSYCAGFPLW